MKDVHIHVLLDRTGSMETIKNDIIGGFNNFINKQKQLPGEATLSLIQFDSQDPYEVIYNFEDIKNVPELTENTFIPRATTPLLDAIGRTINDLNSHITNLNKKPSGIIVVIITDGQENASQEFNKKQVEEMIKEKQSESSWQFVFLSADLDSINDAHDYGFNVGSTMAYDASNVRNMYASLSNSVASYRTGENKNIVFDNNELEE